MSTMLGFLTGLNDLFAQEQSRRARSTCVIDVVNRNASKPKLIETTLSTASASVEIANSRLLDVGVLQLTVVKSFGH